MNPLSIAFVVVLVLNALWFSLAFWYFTITPDSAAKLLVARPARESPLFTTISATIRFVGAMNFAFALLGVLVVTNLDLFVSSGQRSLLAAVFAVTHAGQFLCNVPIALSERRSGTSLWPVLTGPMRFIFIVDGTLAVANATLAVLM